MVHVLHSFCPDHQCERNVPLCVGRLPTPRPEGHISPFQAFCISTASRVGVGNIAGIAIAVVTGGPGAIFWMWVIATLGAASGFIESTLAQIYKVKKPGGGFMGGPVITLRMRSARPSGPVCLPF